jgi:hypothetical protein
MDVTKILTELREEKKQIEEAILSLERLAQGRGNRSATELIAGEGRKRGRPPGSKNKTISATATSPAPSGPNEHEGF